MAVDTYRGEIQVKLHNNAELTLNLHNLVQQKRIVPLGGVKFTPTDYTHIFKNMNKKHKKRQQYKTHSDWFKATLTSVENTKNLTQAETTKRIHKLNPNMTLNLSSQQIRRRDTLSDHGYTNNNTNKNLPGCLVRGALLRAVDNNSDRRSVADGSMS